VVAAHQGCRATLATFAHPSGMKRGRTIRGVGLHHSLTRHRTRAWDTELYTHRATSDTPTRYHDEPVA